MARISTERSIRIYDDDHGWFVRVGPDGDSLGMCQISYHEDEKDTRLERSLSLPWEHAEALAKAILDLAAQHKADQQP